MTHEKIKAAIERLGRHKERGACCDVGGHGEFVCSECGVRVDTTDGFGYEIPTMLLDGVAVAVSYCPNCGRKVV